MTPLEILRKAREAHSDPKMWVQGAQGFGENRGPCCVLGMFYRITGFNSFNQSYHNVSDAFVATVHKRTTVWNDESGRTHAEVLDAYDRTIARLESEANNG